MQGGKVAMVAARPKLNRRKLAKVLSRLDSSHPAEALGAARFAARMLREAGLDWASLLGVEHAPDTALVVARSEKVMSYADWTDALRKAPRWRVVDTQPRARCR